MTHPHRAPELRPPCAPATFSEAHPRGSRLIGNGRGWSGATPDEFLVTIRIKSESARSWSINHGGGVPGSEVKDELIAIAARRE